MQYQSFSLPRALASYMVHVYLEFVGRRSTAQSSSEIFLKLHLLWDVLWLLGSAYFSLHKFSRIYVRHALLFAVSDNMYKLLNVLDEVHETSTLNMISSATNSNCLAQY